MSKLANNKDLSDLERESEEEKKEESQLPEKAGQKKVVGKKVAVAFIMVCIVLSASLVASIAVYTPMINNLESQIAEKDNTIAALTSTVVALNLRVATLQNLTSQGTPGSSGTYSSDIDALNQEISFLNQQVGFLNNLLYLNATEVLLSNQTVSQQPGTNASVWTNPVGYAGYVTVNALSSSRTTYVEVIYSARGANYDNTVIVGNDGTAVFPVLPGLIDIRIGNTEPVDQVDATVTATYYY